ncbi:small RNA 2-O-methyltransferase [Pseudohyphozyma bogoriensis]|nr:small RNA 2-O-methyltransferase [Pseudohyphozyma bogoriensis]
MPASASKAGADEVAAALSQLSLAKSPSPSSSSSKPVASSSAAAEPDKPWFFPPLWMGRRTACVNTLRKEGIRSVVDFGCGAGNLLQVLSLPANHIDDFPSLYPPSVSSSPSSESHLASLRHSKLDKLRAVPRPPADEAELHLRRLVGVDIRRDLLDKATKVTAPPVRSKKEDRWSVERERWEELRVELVEGALETYNETLEGVEAMVATEVIEHLNPSSFNKFSSVVLGNYSPRIVIVTTPNHEFNPYFVPSPKEEESQNCCPDPTGRTNRMFRDSDHQFEFTQAEFEQWAREAAKEHDYKVEFSGVGSLASYFQSKDSIPFPPPSLSHHPALANFPSSKSLPSDPRNFFATQIAVFTKKFSGEPERSPRSHKTTPLPFFSPPPSSVSTPELSAPPTPGVSGLETSPFPLRPNTTQHRNSVPNVPHKLVVTHFHRPHPSANNPFPPDQILRILRDLFTNYFERPVVNLRDLYNRPDVRIACGGLIGSLIDAVVDEEEGEWDFKVDAEKRGDFAIDVVWEKWIESGELKERRKRAEGGQEGSEEEVSDEEEEEGKAAFVAEDSDEEDVRGMWARVL